MSPFPPGRTLRISAPMVGSKLTSQTSPRFGAGAIDRKLVSVHFYTLKVARVRPSRRPDTNGDGVGDVIHLAGRQFAKPVEEAGL